MSSQNKASVHNVSGCTSLCEQYISNPDSSIPEAISLIPDENRISILRGCDAGRIGKRLEAWRGDICAGLERKYGHLASIEAGSADNKTGADIAATLEDGSRLDVELKFGSETNSNVGLATFSRLFGVSLEMPIEIRQKWFKMVYADGERTEEEWHQFRKAYYNGKIAVLNQKFDGQALSEEQGSFLVDSILNSSGSPMGNGRNSVKFVLKRGRMAMAEPVENSGKWNALRTNPIGNPLKNRLNFAVESDALRILFILNWKNTYRKDGIAVPAKYGFGSAAVNVFVRKKKAKQDNDSKQ